MKGRAGAAGLVLFSGLVAMAAPQSFSFEREILPAGAGANRLDVDTALLVGSAPVRHGVVSGRDGAAELVFAGGLEDLRLFDPSGREVPYLVVPEASKGERFERGRVSPVAATKATSGFEADFGTPLRVDRVRIEGLPAPFLKRFLLEGSGDRVRWTVLTRESTLFDLPRERLRRIDVDFSPQEIRYVRVTWDDRMSARMPLPRAVSGRRLERGTADAPLLEAPLAVERRSSEPGKSRFRLRLPGAHLPVRWLEVSAPKTNILREAHVTEPRLAGGEVVPQLLGGGTLRQAVQGDVVASEMRIAIQPPEGSELDLVVDDGDNAPFAPVAVTAVMGPLPWIYFDAPDRRPIVARWGSPVGAGVKAPRYDLEARREAVARSSPPRAAWGKRRAAPVTAASPAAALPEKGGPIATGDFAWARPIERLDGGLNTLALDAAVLAHGELVSIRVTDYEGQQVPYLLEKRDEPLSLDLPALEKTANEASDPARVSTYRVVLPFAQLPPSRLVLETPARVFSRGVSLTVRRENQVREDVRTETLAAASWRHADPETAAPALVLDVPPLPGVEARLLVDEGDNSPLPLSKPRLLLPSYRVRFFTAKDAKLTLRYGAKVAPPRYDLALLAPRLVGAPGHEAALGSEIANASAVAKGALPRTLFWGVLVAAVATLLVLLVRLAKPPSS